MICTQSIKVKSRPRKSYTKWRLNRHYKPIKDSVDVTPKAMKDATVDHLTDVFIKHIEETRND